MKNILLATLLLALPLVSPRAQQNQIRAYALEGQQIDIALAGESPFTAIIMDIKLPEGVTINSGTTMTRNVATTARTKPHRLYARQLDAEANTYRLLAYSTRNATITGLSELNIFRLSLAGTALSAEALAQGTTLSAITAVDEQHAEHTLSATVALEGALQDVNKDGKVDLLDLIATTDLSQNGAQSPSINLYEVRQADSNGDGQIDSEDIEALLNNL